FEFLPDEVHHCILSKLEELHRQGLEIDAVGRQTDLKALLLVNKHWHQLAREHLFREICLPSNSKLPWRIFSFIRPKSRLRLLFDHLRLNGTDAWMVRHLRISVDLAFQMDSVGYPRRRKAAFRLLTRVISRCPNLEQLSGYIPRTHDETGTSLIRTLSKCVKLKTHVWNSESVSAGHWNRSKMRPQEWLKMHKHWQRLETLVICSNKYLVGGPPDIIPAALSHLPNLKHLMLSNLERTQFHDGTLTRLPPLRSLRLEKLEGVTDVGVEQLGRGRTTQTLERLGLIGLRLTSLRTIHELVSALPHLHRFSVVQSQCLEYEAGLELMQSPVLRHLHWDLPTARYTASLIADAMAAGRLPSLRKIKAPCDHTGAIQAQCRPIRRRTLSVTDWEVLEHFQQEAEQADRLLAVVEIEAQARLLFSKRRSEPFVFVVEDTDEVDEENNHPVRKYLVGAYLGRLDSLVEYDLSPDM
ncbi:hypothetical protein K470DRAFT_206216, partial [Piedraia hortae CBS 480.64]